MKEPDYIPPSANPVWLSSLEVADMIIRVGKPLGDGKAVAFDMLLALNDLVLAKRKGAPMTEAEKERAAVVGASREPLLARRQR